MSHILICYLSLLLQFRLQRIIMLFPSLNQKVHSGERQNAYLPMSFRRITTETTHPAWNNGNILPRVQKKYRRVVGLVFLRQWLWGRSSIRRGFQGVTTCPCCSRYFLRNEKNARSLQNLYSITKYSNKIRQ